MCKQVFFLIVLVFLMSPSHAEMNCSDIFLFQNDGEIMTLERSLQKVDREIAALFEFSDEPIKLWDRLTSPEARREHLLQDLRIRERNFLLKKKSELQKIESLILSTRRWVDLSEEDEARLVENLLFNVVYQKALKEINGWMNSDQIENKEGSFMQSSFLYILWGPLFSFGKIPFQHRVLLENTLGQGDIHKFIGLSFRR